MVGDVLSRSWAIFKRSWGTCVGAVLLVLVISLLINGVVYALTGMTGGRNAGGGASPIALIGNIVGSLVGIWLQIGVISLMLKIARGDPSATVNDVFSGSHWIVPFAVASLLFSIIVGIGFVLLIIPGIILALMLWPYQYLVVDGNLALSRRCLRPKKLPPGTNRVSFC